MDFQDVKSLLLTPGDMEPDIADSIKTNEEFQMTHKISRINRGLSAIREKWLKATALQIYVAFDMAGCCIDDLIEQLDDPGFRPRVDNELARRQQTGTSSKPIIGIESEESTSDDDGSDFTRIRRSLPRASLTHRAEPEDSDEFEEPQRKKKRYSKNCPMDLSRIPPCPPTVDFTMWTSWSDAHRKSYLSMESDPNCYLYRNPPVGVERRNGPWTVEEKAKFMERLKEVRGHKTTVDGKWGLFSTAVPGRVGYQCSNFYRQLIADGEVQDSQYIWADGKLHHLSRMKDESAKRKARPPKPPKSKAPKLSEMVMGRYEQWAARNPIPDAIDPLTGEKMQVPTMSPDGYVFDYNSWMKTKKMNCINPYTQEVVKKRDLIVLTIDNFEEFKHQIKLLNP
jgi:hypothetical protein